VLLACDLAADRVDGLAGFAVARTPPGRPFLAVQRTSTFCKTAFVKPAELFAGCVCGDAVCCGAVDAFGQGPENSVRVLKKNLLRTWEEISSWQLQGLII